MTSGLPDLDDLALLVLVAESGSIGQAAARRNLSQPSVSRRMTALERSLGVALLQRTPRGTSLTPAGRALVDWRSSYCPQRRSSRDPSPPSGPVPPTAAAQAGPCSPA